MKLKLIAAIGKNNELGNRGGLPLWNLKTDFKRFRDLTMGHTVVMGQNTFYSLPENVRPMPGRKNVIVSQNNTLVVENATMFNSIPELLENLKNEPVVWIMGGGMIYKQFINLVDELHITHVDGEFEADTFFPEIDQNIWTKISEEIIPSDEKNSHPSVYTIYIKNLLN